MNSPLRLGLLLVCFCPGIRSAQFYEDSTTGDDKNPGTSPEKAWRSLEKANAGTFAPGDRVQFRADSVWSSALVIAAQGTADRPVVFEAYGSGPRPRIDAAGRFEDAVLISNAQHVVLREFEVTNKGAEGSGGNTPPRRGVNIVADNV